MKKALCVFIFLCGGTLFFGSIAVADVKPEMFAYGAKLEVSDNEAFYEIEVPLSMYKGMTRKDLGDIRVFNGASQVVPHAIRKPVAETMQKNRTISALPFFPIFADRNQKLGDLSIHVARNSQGTIVDVNATEGPANTENKSVVSYLIDAGSLKNNQIIDLLELTWDDAGADFLGQIAVESSADLVTWRQLSTATIARLDYLGHRLDRNRIVLNRPQQKYLRLTWPPNQEPLALTKIVALAQENYVVATPTRQWLSQNSQVLKEGNTDKFYVDLQAFLPVDRLKIRLPATNSLANVKLFSADTKTGPLTEQWRGLIYNLNLKGQQITNSEIDVRPLAHQYWVVEVEKTETQGTTLPVLEFGWLPDRLVFLAQGEGPFLMAYGSAEIQPTNFHVAELIKKYSSLVDQKITPKLIQPGPQYVLGGEDQLKAPLAVPWKKFLLWAALIAGVGLIGWMSLTLYRQLLATAKGKNQ